MSIVSKVGAGLIAGAVGTAAMDLVWYQRHRRQGGQEGLLHWEFGRGVTTWDAASAPGQVGRKLEHLLTGHNPPDGRARATTNGVHWATGVGWGVSYAIARILFPDARTLGLALGPTAWLTSYVALPLLKVYKPIWKYDALTLGKDLSAHLVFGLTAASVFAMLGRRRHTRRT